MPEIGEIKKGRELGFEAKNASRKFIWRVCENCGSGRWIRADNFRETCGACSIKRIYALWLEKNTGQRGNRNPNWKGGRISGDGYVQIRLDPSDPFYSMTKTNGYIPEHRLVVARRLGRCLERWEQVHHIDGNKQNNNDLNLVIATVHPRGYTAGYKQGIKDGIEISNNELLKEIRILRLQMKALIAEKQNRLWRDE